MRKSLIALLIIAGTVCGLNFVTVGAQQASASQNSPAWTHLNAARAAATTPDAASILNTLCNRNIPGLLDVDHQAAAGRAGGAAGRGAAAPAAAAATGAAAGGRAAGGRGAGAPAGADGAAAPAPARGRAAGPPARDTWYTEPLKIFDNMYYVGDRSSGVYAVTTSAGIVVINAIYDYNVEAEVVDGLRKLGFKPEDIKDVIISHAHVDHHGGAKYLQDTFKANVWLSKEDWDFMYTPGAFGTGRVMPRRDKELSDGQKLVFGDTTITSYTTPGHTPGTITLFIPLKDGGRSHLGSAWGGVGFNFTPTAENFRMYAASAKRVGDLAAAAGVDVLLAPHPNQDGGNRKMPMMATRQAGNPHPFVVGPQAVKNYYTVMNHCALYKAELAVTAAATAAAAPNAAPAR